MANRVGGGGSPQFIPPPGMGGDNRLDQQREQMIKDLRERQVVHTRDEAEHVVGQIMRTMQGGGGGLKVAPLDPDGLQAKLRDKQQDAQTQPTKPDRTQNDRPDRATGADKAIEKPGRIEDLPRAVADFQREHGLPVTGKVDAQTLQGLKDKGIVTSQQAPGQPQKTPATDKEQAAARKLNNMQELGTKLRVEQHEPHPPSAHDSHVEAVADPAKLMVSLFNAGFMGKKGSLEDGIKAFQATFGQPITSKLDKQTLEAMKKQGIITEADVPPPKRDVKEKETEPQKVKRALAESTAADKKVEKDSPRPQAATNRPTTSNDVAARAPATAASEAQDKMRLDNSTAQQAAVERGVQERTGDLAATAGHGEVEGQGQGVSGKGGAVGGGEGTTGKGAVGPQEGEVGEESAVGNSKAGDDNFVDEGRGQASIGNDTEGDAEGHYQVPPLSEQVVIALEAIARDDDGSGPVTYTWDVTFYRPGVYSPGQPAEELWHVAVVKATAFDKVWQMAADAIAAKMLYLEPEATPPTLDDFVYALQKARYR